MIYTVTLLAQRTVDALRVPVATFQVTMGMRDPTALYDARDPLPVVLSAFSEVGNSHSQSNQCTHHYRKPETMRAPKVEHIPGSCPRIALRLRCDKCNPREPNLLTFGLVMLLLIAATALGVVWPLLLIVGAGPVGYLLKDR